MILNPLVFFLNPVYVMFYIYKTCPYIFDVIFIFCIDIVNNSLTKTVSDQTLDNLIVIDSINTYMLRKEIAILLFNIKYCSLLSESLIHVVKVVPLLIERKPVVYRAFKHLEYLDLDHTFPIFIVFGIIFLISTLSSLSMLSYFGLYGAFLNNIPSLLIF